jgi:hypothetical protein
VCRVASRTPSSLSVRSKDSPKADTSTPGTPRIAAPPLSRNPSTTTVTQSKHFLPPSPHLRNTRPVSTTAPARRFESNTGATGALSPAAETTTSSPASSSSSSSSSSSDGELVSRSHAFRRPQRFQARKPSLAEIDDDDSDDDEDSPTFLPFAQPNATSKTQQPRSADPGATLRSIETRPAPTGRFDDTAATSGQRSKTAAPTTSKAPDTNDGARTPERTGKGKGKQPASRPALSSPASSSASSASAAFVAGIPPQSSGSGHPQQAKGHHHRVETLSPRHRSELARLSPRRHGSKASGGSGGRAAAHENSDGTPSMGSSFSDLDGELTPFFPSFSPRPFPFRRRAHR